MLYENLAEVLGKKRVMGGSVTGRIVHAARSKKLARALELARTDPLLLSKKVGALIARKAGELSDKALEPSRARLGHLMHSLKVLESGPRVTRALGARTAHYAGLAPHLPAAWRPQSNDIRRPTAQASYILRLLIQQGRIAEAREILNALQGDPQGRNAVATWWVELCRAGCPRLETHWQLPLAARLARDVLAHRPADADCARMFDLMATLPQSHAQLLIHLDRLAGHHLGEKYRASKWRRSVFNEYFTCKQPGDRDPRQDALAMLEHFEQAAQPGEAAPEVFHPIYNSALRQLVGASLTGAARGVEGQSPLTGAGARAFMANIDERLADWRRSPAYRHLIVSERERRETRCKAQEAAASRRPDARLRLLIISGSNWNFVGPMLEPLAAEGLEVRTFPFDQLSKVKNGPFKVADLYRPHQLHSDVPSTRAELREREPLYSELIDWCDVVLVEWCNEPALWLSRFLDERKKLVIRLHSYEAFSHWPFTVNWGGADGLIFVAETIRGFFNAQHGERLQGVTQTVLPNISYTEINALKLSEERRFTLGMASYATQNKNPLLAFDILRHLRKLDPRWTLRLVGNGWPASDQLSAQEAQYCARFVEVAESADLRDAILFEPFRSDLGPWFDTVGFILSCSDREGTHEVVREGMASGAIPVIRDWPMVKAFGGARAVYPGLDRNIYDDVETAVAIILREQARMDEAAAEAQAFFRDHYEPEIVAKRYAGFLQNPAAAVAEPRELNRCFAEVKTECLPE